MRDFDAACLETVSEMKPEDIRALREREHVSQSGVVVENDTVGEFKLKQFLS